MLVAALIVKALKWEKIVTRYQKYHNLHEEKKILLKMRKMLSSFEKESQQTLENEN